MHVELSVGSEGNTVQHDQEQSHPEDTQRISGSQVACAFAKIEQGNTQLNKQSRFQVVTLSFSAVFAIVAVYLVFVLAL